MVNVVNVSLLRKIAPGCCRLIALLHSAKKRLLHFRKILEGNVEQTPKHLEINHWDRLSLQQFAELGSRFYKRRNDSAEKIISCTSATKIRLGCGFHENLSDENFSDSFGIFSLTSLSIARDVGVIFF